MGVVQIKSYIVGTARRLEANKVRRLECTWSKFKRFTYLPVIVAECFSWCGVLSGITKFFCAEYVMWMLMAITWVWDSTVLLQRSRSRRDIIGHGSLLLAGLLLLFFNAVFEIPHFFTADEDQEAGGLSSAFVCRQDADSSLWTKRLPFFFAYFLVCSWSSVAISYRMFRAYGWGCKRYDGEIQRA